MQYSHCYATVTAMLLWKCNMVHRSCYQGKPDMSQYIADETLINKYTSVPCFGRNCSVASQPGNQAGRYGAALYKVQFTELIMKLPQKVDQQLMFCFASWLRKIDWKVVTCSGGRQYDYGSNPMDQSPWDARSRGLNVVTEWLALLFRIWEVPRSNLGLDTDSPDWCFSWLLVLPGKFRDSTSN
jgi:hypothetical protein